MTFNPAIPLNSDSPSIFPTQSQVNYGRLQTIIGGDHQFNLSAAPDDGYHNVVHLTQQAPSGALAATGRLYVKSIAGLIELYYMDDAGLEQQITPFSALVPIKVSGSQVIAGNATITILNVPYDFTGTGVALISGTVSQRTYSFNRSGAFTDITEINSTSGPVSRPTIQFAGTTLTVKNQSGSAQTVVWSLSINRT